MFFDPPVLNDHSLFFNFNNAYFQFYLSENQFNYQQQLLLENLIAYNPQGLSDWTHLTEEMINHPLPNGELPLHFAIRQGSFEAVQILFNHPNIFFEKIDDQNLSALDHLFLNQDEEFKIKVLGLFFEQTIRDVRGSVNLSLIENEATKNLLDRIKDISPIFPFQNGVSSLHIAALNGDINKIQELISKNVKMNTPDVYGYTPLHYAVFSQGDNSRVFRFLVKNGANPLIQTAGIPSPLSLMIFMAQQRSSEKDPLKLDWLQAGLCVCTIATFLQSCYGNQSDLLTRLLPQASLLLSSALSVDQLLKIYEASPDLSTFAKSSAGFGFSVFLSAFDSIPYVGELFLLLRTAAIAKSSIEGIRIASRNCNLDPTRSFKVLTLNSINISMNTWNLYERLKISTSFQFLLDILYRQPLAELNVKLNRCTSAVLTASTIQEHAIRDRVFTKVFDQCKTAVALEAVDMIKKPSSKQVFLQKVFQHVLTRNLKKATLIAEKIDGKYKVAYLVKIKNHYLHRKDCESAFNVVRKISINEMKERIQGFSGIITADCSVESVKFQFEAAKQLNEPAQGGLYIQLAKNISDSKQCSNALSLANSIKSQDSRDDFLLEIIKNSHCQIQENVIEKTFFKIHGKEKKNLAIELMPDHVWTNIHKRFVESFDANFRLP